MKKTIAMLLIAMLIITAAMPLTAFAYEKKDLKRTLSKGMEGEDVKAVQTLLSDYGYFTKTVDGVYSDDVRVAVIRFQRANSLTVDGKTGSKTWSKLIGDKVVKSADAPTSGEYAQEDIKRIMKMGDKGIDVENVQERLAYYGYYSGPVNGKYTATVKDAVQQFQTANFLKKDGKVGPNTWQKLISSDAYHKFEYPDFQRIEYGTENDLVLEAQKQLIALGYMQGEPGRKFGNEMKQAVMQFQKRNDLKQDGVIGQETWAWLYDNSAVKYSDPGFNSIEQGMAGVLVEEIQYALRNSYYYTGKVDGEFTKEVKDAIKAFQSSEKGLTVDGVVGKKTWDALVNRSAGIFNGAIPIRELSRTMRGQDVYVLQQRLVNLNYLKEDSYQKGVYGEETVQAVIRYQQAFNLPETGKMDSSTRRHLWPSDVDNEDVNKVEDIEDLPKLRIGSTGDAVKNIQMRLKSGGFLPGKADGIFGEKTEKAVKALQSKYGLWSDGVIGIDTWQVLQYFDVTYADPETVDPEKQAISAPERKLKKGNSGTDVMKLQKQLIELNYLAEGEADGKFGEKTRNAVIAFQAANDLKQDGIVGRKTFSAIYEILGNPI